MSSTIPTVDVDKVANGILGVEVALRSCLQTFSNATMAFFLELVPERGEALWNRFKTWKKEPANTDLGFSDFVSAVTRKNIFRVSYPKVCILDRRTQEVLATEILTAAQKAGAKTNDDVLGIFFGQGPVYEAARKISCRGCPQSKCPHILGHRP